MLSFPDSKVLGKNGMIDVIQFLILAYFITINSVYFHLEYQYDSWDGLILAKRLPSIIEVSI